MTKLLDKLVLSGSLQIAALLVLTSVLLLVLEQVGYGVASREYIAFATATVGYVMGKRAQSETP